MSGTVVRAIRGATTVEEDSEDAIRIACRELFAAMLEQNGIKSGNDDSLISVIVTTTDDLHSMFPAKAIREECGLADVPLLGAIEATVEGAPTQAIRVMAHVNTDKPRSAINHVFQGRAPQLRPDISPA